MADYTMTVEEAMLAVTGATQWEEYSDVDDLISAAAPKIFDFQYDFYNPSAKQAFEYQFLLNFMFREICTTPLGRWKVMLRARLQEIMPYYTKLWQSEGFTYDPLTTVDLSLTGGDSTTETTSYTRGDTIGTKSTMSRQESGGGASHTDASSTGSMEGTTGGTLAETNSGEHSESGNTSGNELRKFSDTPQNNIPWDETTGINYLTDVTNTSTNGNNYSSGENSGKHDQETTGSSTENTTGAAESDSHNNWDATYGQQDGTDTTLAREDSTEFGHGRDWHEERTGKGESPTYQQLIQEWRDLIIEYNRRIFADCSDLFFQLY